MDRHPGRRHAVARARISARHAAHRDARERLVADLIPVRRLSSPPLRALGWIVVVLAIAVAIGSVSNLGGLEHRLMAVPDMWLAVLGSSATSLLAALAAFELCVPDRSRLWALAPLPGLALWIGASGLGCSWSWLLPGIHEASLADSRTCIYFIVGLSVPLSLIMMYNLRRGYSLTPTLTGAVAGLAVAAASATLLNLFHPFDAAIEDLLVHATAVLVVVIANRTAATRLLGGRLARKAGAIEPVG